MDLIKIENGEQERVAVYFEELPGEDGIRELVDAMMGISESSKDLLAPVFPGSVPDKMGARHTMFLSLKNVPKGGFGKGGIYGVTNWVEEVLNAAMPEGWGGLQLLSQQCLIKRTLRPVNGSMPL